MKKRPDKTWVMQLMALDCQNCAAKLHTRTNLQAPNLLFARPSSKANRCCTYPTGMSASHPHPFLQPITLSQIFKPRWPCEKGCKATGRQRRTPFSLLQVRISNTLSTATRTQSWKRVSRSALRYWLSGVAKPGGKQLWRAGPSAEDSKWKYSEQ